MALNGLNAYVLVDEEGRAARFAIAGPPSEEGTGRCPTGGGRGSRGQIRRSSARAA